VTLTASNITDGNPNSSITQVTFYLVSNNDGMLEPGTDTLLGYATRTAGAAVVSIGPAIDDGAAGRRGPGTWPRKAAWAQVLSFKLERGYAQSSREMRWG
jgi:hypothetical protein